jgi:hypothetical protein
LSTIPSDGSVAGVSALRFDRVIRSAGLLRRVKTYSVVLEDGVLYLLAVGPGMRATQAHDPLTQGVLGSMASGYEATIRAGEQRLAEESLDQLSGGKDCFKLARQDIAAVDLRKDVYGLPRLVLRTTQGKIRFQFRGHSMEQVQTLVDALKQR